MEGEGVEFVVAHHGQGRAGIDHTADDRESLSDGGPAVDEVTEKDRLPPWMAVDAVAAGVAEHLEQSHEGARVAVNVADEVVHRPISPREGQLKTDLTPRSDVSWTSRTRRMETENTVSRPRPWFIART
jgi:hypothetical protein